MPKPTYPSLLWPAEWKAPAPLAITPAYWLPAKNTRLIWGLLVFKNKFSSYWEFANLAIAPANWWPNLGSLIHCPVTEKGKQPSLCAQEVRLVETKCPTLFLVKVLSLSPLSIEWGQVRLQEKTIPWLAIRTRDHLFQLGIWNWKAFWIAEQKNCDIFSLGNLVFSNMWC